MKTKLPLFFFLFHIISGEADAQLPPQSIGLKFGATYSGIDDLETTVKSKPLAGTPITYTLKEQRRFGPVVGLFGLWTIKGDYDHQERLVAVQAGMLYTAQGSNLLYEDKQRDFHYKMEFRYQYINIPLDIKVFPFGTIGRKNEWLSNWPNILTGFNVGLGAQLGVNIASTNIVYKSNLGSSSIYGTDLDQQQQLRNVLKGRDNFGFRAMVGYEFITNSNNNNINKGISLEFSYYYGLTDVVETMPNFSDFIENRNRNQCFQATIGIDFSLLKEALQ